MSDIYNESYFAWQRTIGEFGGQANLFKFESHIKPTDAVLDFGCGGGYLLKNLTCGRKLGVEVNPAAANVAARNGIEIFASTDDIADNSIDVIVSNHALEHVRRPFDVLSELRGKLVAGGLLVLVVPYERTTTTYEPGDINQHLYTWTPQLMGNLAAQAGYTVVDVFPIYHRWPPHFLRLQKLLGWKMFHLLCRVYGRYKTRNIQVKLIARRESEHSAASA